jgi:hypothetical protein
MERRFHLVEAEKSLKDARVDDADDDLRAIVVEREGQPAGLAPPRSGLWREARSRALIGRFVERPPAIGPGSLHGVNRVRLTDRAD